MARITVEDCLDNIPNRFALVMLVSKRTKELMKGAPMVVKAKDNKFVVSALREVATGRVRYESRSDDPSTISEIEQDLRRETQAAFARAENNQ